MLNDSEQEYVFRMISKGKEVGSLRKLEEIVHIIDSEILKELITRENVNRHEDDFVVNAQTGQDDWLSQLLNPDEKDPVYQGQEKEQFLREKFVGRSSFISTENRLRIAESMLRSSIEVLEQLKTTTLNVISK